MAKEHKYSLLNLKKDFPTDSACTEFIFDALHSRTCSCGGTYALLKERRQFQCSKCRFQIAPTVGTIFEKSPTPMTLWFHALWVFSNAKSGISAKELERQIGVTYKTAWRMLRLIREQLSQSEKKLRGDVEMDETYFGGRKSAGKNNKDLSAAMRAKTVIAGAVQRGGEVRAKTSPSASSAALGQFLADTVEVKGTRLLTDESNRYDKIALKYMRQRVNHTKKEFAVGDVYVNTIESFWSHVKRSVRGTHKSISKQHLQSYLGGFAWHYNNRHNDNQRFVSLLGVLLRASEA